MTLRQLRFLREVARQSLNISNAAAALYTSQPGVSRQIQLLERELGVDLLQRRKNRILGFTEAGRRVLSAAQRMLNDAENIKQIASEARNQATGKLMLATSHLHARYTLLGPVKRFVAQYPDVELHLQQSNPYDVPRLLESGEADVGVSTDLPRDQPGLAVIPCESIRRSLIVPRGHPLARARRVSLRDIARHPIVGYARRFRTGQILTNTFSEHGIEAKFVVSASDSDVIKAYVAQGLGVAVVPTVVLEGTDSRVHAIDVTTLFPRSVTKVGVRRDYYPRAFVAEFIRLLIPGATRATVQAALEGASRS